MIDTGMQHQLRGADPAAFPDIEMFRKLQRDGMLASPAQAAAQVIAYLLRPEFGSSAVADVRDA